MHLNKFSETTEHLPLFKHGKDEHESFKTLITKRFLFVFCLYKIKLNYWFDNCFQ